MKIGIVSGSHRKDSQSIKVARYQQERIKDLLSAETYVLNLGENPIPLWEESVWAGDEKWKSLWSPISEELKTCHGFIVITPEWSGMATSGIKNFFLMCGGGELRHKPAMITTVSASRGGAYPVAELRMSSYKNTSVCYIPEHIIVRNSADMLNGESPANDDDIYLRKRIDYAVKLLGLYANALESVHTSEIIDAKNYPFGM